EFTLFSFLERISSFYFQLKRKQAGPLLPAFQGSANAPARFRGLAAQPFQSGLGSYLLLSFRV
ncbi:MAG: hypothetical protein II631_08110, partial [Treponema sp.]|nr:hypothetical protein [Treponema sp.]